MKISPTKRHEGPSAPGMHHPLVPPLCLEEDLWVSKFKTAGVANFFKSAKFIILSRCLFKISIEVVINGFRQNNGLHGRCDDPPKPVEIRTCIGFDPDSWGGLLAGFLELHLKQNNP